MAFLKASTPYVLATALVAAGLVPAPAAVVTPHPAVVTPPAAGSAAALEEPVMTFSLTDAGGARTAVATDGIEALEAEAVAGAAAQGDLSAAGVGGAGAGVSGAAPVVGGATEELEDVAILTPPMETRQFFVAGVTWDGDGAMPEDAAVFLRVLEDGQWHEWVELEVEPAPKDGDGAIGGTEPFVAGGATAVQLQVTGEAAALPADIRLSLTPAYPAAVEEVHTEPTDQPAELPAEAPTAEVEAENVGFFQDSVSAKPAVVAAHASGSTAGAVQLAAAGQPAPAVRAVTAGRLAASVRPAARGVLPAAPAQPSIVSRAGWGADPKLMTWPVRRADLKAAVVHHTAGSNTYTQAEAPSVVRGIYRYHAVERQWGDIGYNFLVDKWGRVYEGRTGSLSAPAGTMPVAAHAGGFNTGTLGISAMGDYTKVAVPQATMNAMADVIAWQFSRAGIDASTPSGITSPGTNYTRRGINLPRIFGHRDVGQTTCPGNDIYGRLSGLISTVSAKVGAVSGSAPAVRPNIFLNNGWGHTADTVFRFGDPSGRVFSGDWDGDGTDTVAVRVGQAFYIRNSNTGGGHELVFTFGSKDDTILVGDWDGDGVDSFAIRRGKDYLIRNSLSTGAAEYTISYGHAGDEVVVGDWDGDGTDTLAVRRAQMYYFKNSVTGGPADVVAAYGRPDDVVIVGDWDGNGVDTLAVRRAHIYYIKNSLRTGVADLVLPYGRAGDSVIVGDWDGNGTDTLGVRR